MRIEIKNDVERKQYLFALDKYIKENNDVVSTLYVQLGSKVVRIICYSEDLIPHIEKQLTYILREQTENYDATIVVWHEDNFDALRNSFYSANSHLKLLARLHYLVSKTTQINFSFMDDEYSAHNPLIFGDNVSGIVRAIDQESNMYYYGVNNLEPEEFIKQGHIFVQMFNKIVKTDDAGLVHGALVGTNNKGLLFCGRGNRGKSTLSVLSMLNGLDYVSDDYLLLEREGKELYSYPIYSIITLTPLMYKRLYNKFDGKFISNNARKDKYVFNIENYHDRFRMKYPVHACVFTEIVGGDTPSVVKCSKGRAVTQLVHSTIRQLEDTHDIKTIQKLMGFVNDFEFYQVNLSDNIEANVKCFKEFCGSL